jgi:hypothetical protein
MCGVGFAAVPAIWYDCSDNAASVTILDSAGDDNASFGVNTSTLSATGMDGNANTAFQLDTEITSRITLGSAFTFTGDADGSAYNIWINPPLTVSAVLMFEDADNIIRFQDANTEGSIALDYILATATTSIPLSEIVTPLEWQMWTIVYETDDDINIYKDGVNVGSGSVDDSVNQLDFTEIGRSGKATWAVKFDDIAILDTALTSTEVASLYSEGIDQRSIVVGFCTDIHSAESSVPDFYTNAGTAIQDGPTPRRRFVSVWERNVRQFADKCEEFDVDLAIIGGDLVDLTSVSPTTMLEEAYDKIEEEFVTNRGIPWIHSFGNHEQGQLTLAEFTTAYENATGITTQGENEWPDVPSNEVTSYLNESKVAWFTVGAVSAPAGAATVPSTWDSLVAGINDGGQTQSDWLTAALAETNAPVILMSHEHINDGDGSAVYPSSTRDVIDAALQTHGNTIHTFAGHYHQVTPLNPDINAYTVETLNNIIYTETAGATLQNDLYDIDNNNFTIWRIYHDGTQQLLFRFTQPEEGPSSSFTGTFRSIYK